jgi:NADH-quinone oxidoreductase subunit A
MLHDYAYIGAFLVVGVLFVAVAFFAAWLLRPRRPNPVKLDTYECGEPAFGGAWIQYNVRYYLYALVFVVFDVETVFLYPWAVAFRQLGLFALVEMLIFIGILVVGLAYAWRKGFLKWV